MNQSFYVNQNDLLTKRSDQIKFGSGLRLPHDRPGLKHLNIPKKNKVNVLKNHKTVLKAKLVKDLDLLT